MGGAGRAPLIGAHVSTRGGIDKAVDNAESIGAEVFQTHPTPGQQWRTLHLDEIMLRTYHDKYAASTLRGHYLHAVYLINLATPKQSLLRQSIDSLVHYMDLARLLHAAAVVFHPGSHLGAGLDASLPQIGRALGEVLRRSDGDALLLVENSAGSGGCVGRGLEEIAAILDAANHDRVGVCFDTQHAFASGYDLRTVGGVRSIIDQFERIIGMERLALVHANDSSSGLGSNRDRHTNIGEGELGLAGFGALLADDRLRRVPWVLEVPGDGTSGPDRDNINRLRRCAGLPDAPHSPSR